MRRQRNNSQRILTVQHIRQTAGTKRGAEDDVTVSPAKRAHTSPFPLTQALLLSATGMKAMLVPGDAVRISTHCEEHVWQPDVKVVFDTAGELRDHYSGLESENHWNQQRDQTDREDLSAYAKT